MPQFNFGQVIIAALENEQRLKEAAKQRAEQSRQYEATLAFQKTSSAEQASVQRERFQTEKDWHAEQSRVAEQYHNEQIAEARRINPDIGYDQIKSLFKTYHEKLPEDITQGSTLPYSRVLDLIKGSSETRLKEMQLKILQDKIDADAADKKEQTAVRSMLTAGNKTAEKLFKALGEEGTRYLSPPVDTEQQGVLGKIFSGINKELGSTVDYGGGWSGGKQTFTEETGLNELFSPSTPQGHAAWVKYGNDNIARANKIINVTTGQTIDEKVVGEIDQAIVGLQIYLGGIKTGVVGTENITRVSDLIGNLYKIRGTYNPIFMDVLKKASKIDIDAASQNLKHELKNR